MPAATSKASASWLGLSGKERQRTTRRAFAIRAKLRDGKPVTEAERAMLARYEADPERPRKRRHLHSPPASPMPITPFSQPNITETPAEAPADVAGAPESPDALPSLLVGDAPESKPPGTSPHGLTRAQVEQQANALYKWGKETNTKNRAEGKFSIPDGMYDFFMPGCAMGFTERHGGLVLSPKQEDAVVCVGLGLPLVVSMLPPPKKKDEEKKPAANAQPVPQPSPAPVPSPMPEPAHDDEVDDKDSPV
jgi:hypothetical protein